MLSLVEREQRAGHRVVDIDLIDCEVRAVGLVERLSAQRRFHEGARHPRPRQMRAVDPAGAHIDALEAVVARIDAAVMLGRKLGEAVDADRPLRMVFIHQRRFEIAVGLFRADVDNALDAAEPHRFE